MLRLLLSSVSHVALTSNQERRILNQLRYRNSRASVVYNGFEPPNTLSANSLRFRTDYGITGSPIVLHVASVKPNKGHETMIEGLADLTERYPNLQYVCVGPVGGLWQGFSDQIQAHIESYGLQNHVSILGRVTDDSLADAYAASDIVVVPSLSETFPLSALDAMAWRKPIVATRVGGIPEMLEHGRTAMLVAPGDSDALASAIGKLLDTPTLGSALGQRAREDVVKRFSWGAVMDRYDDIAARLVSQNSLRS